MDRTAESIVFPVRNLQEYEALFEGAASEKAIGEISPHYMASKYTALSIADRLPRVKLIAILQNGELSSDLESAARAYSEEHLIWERFVDRVDAMMHDIFSRVFPSD